MIPRRPLAGAILAATLVAGSTAAPASAAPTGAPIAPSVSQVSATLTASSAQAAARPRNGKILFDRISGGVGVLKIKNGTRKDAVVTLVKGRSKAISLYVRARSTASVKNVRDGTYRIFFTSGYRFKTSKGRFSRAATYQRFEKRLKFRTTATQATIWTLTLNPVQNGNARTRNVNPKDFPA